MRFLILAIPLTLLPAFAYGQAATTLQQLSTSDEVEAGDPITVATTSGTRVKGRLQQISQSEILVERDGRPVSITASDIRVIEHRDSIADGMLIGLGAGVAAALVTTYSMCGSNDSECSAIVNVVVGVPVSIGGAALGALTDSWIRKTVYRGRSDVTLHVQPLLSRQTRGALLAIRF